MLAHGGKVTSTYLQIEIGNTRIWWFEYDYPVRHDHRPQTTDHTSRDLREYPLFSIFLHMNMFVLTCSPFRRVRSSSSRGRDAACCFASQIMRESQDSKSHETRESQFTICSTVAHAALARCWHVRERLCRCFRGDVNKHDVCTRTLGRSWLWYVVARKGCRLSRRRVAKPLN